MEYKKKNKNKSIQIVLIALAILTIVCSMQISFAANETITPDTSGGISEAITNTEDKGTLTLEQGTYNKTTDRGITITQSITIKGNGPTDKVIIDGKNDNRMFTIGADNINVTFINLTFINGQAPIDSNGGVILNEYSNSKLTFIDCSFISNIGLKGGAIFNTGNYLKIIDSRFINNRAVDEHNVTWEEKSEGGAISNSGDYMTVIASSFSDNFGFAGGAIANTGDYLTVIDSIFADNDVSMGVGKILKDTQMNYYGSDLTNVGFAGGAISNNGAYMTIISSKFSNNIGEYGGAIYNMGAYMNISNSIFTENEAGMGGAIYDVNEHYSTVTDSKFSYNRADAYGGAILNSGEMTISNSSFNFNNAERGGAIYNWEGYKKISGSNFTKNSVEDFGGAIYNRADMLVSNSNFNANEAQFGGAIYNVLYPDLKGVMNVTNSVFTKNYANKLGGAIFNDGVMLVSNNSMTGNIAELGKMIYNNGSMGVLKLTFLNNATLKVVKGQTVTLFATLTDDMGNTVTGGNINFYVNGKNIGSATPIEGYASLKYTATSTGTFPVTGEYTSHDGYEINIYQGLLVVTASGNNDTNKTNKTVNNIVVYTNDDSTTVGASMKKTGIPIIALILLVLNIFGICVKRRD